jgi:hypothetical protein
MNRMSASTVAFMFAVCGLAIMVVPNTVYSRALRAVSPVVSPGERIDTAVLETLDRSKYWPAKLIDKADRRCTDDICQSFTALSPLGNEVTGSVGCTKDLSVCQLWLPPRFQ